MSSNKKAIDQATNNAGVDTAKSNGLDSINNIQPTVVKKDKKTAIDKAAEAKSGNRPNTKRDRRRKSSSKSENR